MRLTTDLTLQEKRLMNEKQRYRQLKIKQKKTLNGTGISELWDNLKTPNIHIIDTSTGIKRRRRQKQYLEN